MHQHVFIQHGCLSFCRRSCRCLVSLRTVYGCWVSCRRAALPPHHSGIISPRCAARECVCAASYLSVLLNNSFADICVAEDGTIHISLQKMRKGETWQCVFKGHGALDPVAETEIHKAMLLQRFGEEHPGFDFSGAGVSGGVPDPRTFMGGVKYT